MKKENKEMQLIRIKKLLKNSVSIRRIPCEEVKAWCEKYYNHTTDSKVLTE